MERGPPYAQDMWAALSIEPSWVEQLLELKLHFRSGRLCVSNALADDDTLTERVSAVRLHLWRFFGATQTLDGYRLAKQAAR